MDQAGEHERPPRSRTGLIVWISGTAKPGDPQLASELSRMLAETRHVEVLDAHVVQHQLTPGPQDSLSDGSVPDRSLAWIARLLSRHGVSAVVALASPCSDTRREVQARAAAEGLRFVDIALNGMESREVLIDQVTELLRESGSEARDEISRRAGAKSESSIVVVRDRDPAALQNPPRRTFGDRGAVTYLHAATRGDLPAARHYFLNLDRLDDFGWLRASRAREQGRAVTIIVRNLDAAAAAELARSSWNVIPAYGETEHIGFGTLRHAVRLACDGHRVVARGFLGNSGAGWASDSGRRRSTFLQLLHQMSEEACAGVRVVAAVLAPQRTGSQMLRDLIGWTVGSGVRVFHAHGIPPADVIWPDTHSLVDALALEPDPHRQTLMRRAALRSVLLSARRRYLFLAARDPLDRVVSYFVKRKAGWLRERLGASGCRFDGAAEIQRDFEVWLRAQTAHHARWFERTLLEPFGLQVSRAQATSDGLLVTHNGPNTLIVVPTEMLDALRAVVEAEYRSGRLCAPSRQLHRSARRRRADSCLPSRDPCADRRGKGLARYSGGRPREGGGATLV